MLPPGASQGPSMMQNARILRAPDPKLLQNASVRGMVLGGSMLAAVLLVVGLAYLDLQRDQAQAQAEFVDAETVLAETLAATLQARLEHGSSDFSGMFRAAESDVWQRIVAVSGDRAVDLVPNPRGWPPFQLDTRPGTVDRDHAESLGIGKRRAVAVVARVAGQPWSVMVVSSARRVRDRARLGTQRLLAATGLVCLLVLLFGALVLRQNRRALALAEKLRLRERSEEIVESLPLGVLALDAEGRVASVNRFLQVRGAKIGPFAEALAIDDAEREPLSLLIDEARRTCSRRRPARSSCILQEGRGRSCRVAAGSSTLTPFRWA
jgi:hypothetical protein